MKTILSKTKKWYLQRSSTVPHTNHFVCLAVAKGIDDIEKGTGLDHVLTFFDKEGDLGTWATDQDEMAEKGRLFEESPELFEKMFNLWKNSNKEFLDFVERLQKEGIKDVLNEYNEFYEKYIAEYSPAMVVEYYMVYSDIVMNRIRNKIPKKDWQLIEGSIMPFKKTFVYDEQESLFGIALDIDDVKEVDLPENLDKIRQHQSKFFWLQNTYKYTEPIPVEVFKENVVELLKIPKEELKERFGHLENYESEFVEKKKKVEQELNLSEEDKKALEMLSKVAWWHDHRKKANMIANYWINEFLKKASKDVPFLEMQFTLPSEFIEYLKTGNLDRDMLKERIKGCVSLNTVDGEEHILTGEEFEGVRKQILEGELDININELKGTPASLGNVKGKVKVILDPRNAEIEKGAILVTSMTRPDFVPLMKNAGAIVTDEGGVTSHAAIVSRELGIPCIVGTRIATKVLKDNQLVEVKGNHGVVKIIKS